MSLTQRQLNAARAAGTNSPPTSTNVSDAESDAETMSNASTSDSGRSVEIGGTSEHTQRLRDDGSRLRDVYSKKATSAAIAVAVAKHRRDDPLDGEKSYCSMCNINPSEYSCTHCGRLCFCTKCCLNLHDNKYLSNHKFRVMDSIPEGAECVLDDIKRKKQQREEEERAGRKAIQTSILNAADSAGAVATVQQSAAPSPKASKSKALVKTAVSAPQAPTIDMASLTADKSVINVRLRELQTCLESGQQLHKELSQERTATKETTTTAVEAVRKRFDVLRSLIAAKEDQFVAVVEQAGKERYDLATAAACSINIATSELDGFISHMSLLMNRLEENKVQFNAQRQGMLDSTYSTLAAVDGWTHDHQSRLQDIRSLSLGVHVPIDTAADAIQAIQPPKYLTYRATEEGRKGILSVQEAASVPVGEILSPIRQRQEQSVPAAKFVDAPGVKVVVQTQTIKRPNAIGNGVLGSNNNVSGVISSRTASPIRNDALMGGRKLHTVEQQELRNTPMREIVRAQSKPQQQPLLEGPANQTNGRKASSPVRAAATSAATGSAANAAVRGIGGAPLMSSSSNNGGRAASASRTTTPTRRVVYGRSDSGVEGHSISSAVGRPSVGTRGNSGLNVSTTSSKYADPYAQRIVAAAIKTNASRTQSPNNNNNNNAPQRFTTSPVRGTTSPTRGGTSSFALPTANSAVRRGGSPSRPAATTAAASSYRGSTDNPGPGSYNVPNSTFGVRRSPMRR